MDPGYDFDIHFQFLSRCDAHNVSQCEIRPAHASFKYTEGAPMLPRPLRKEKWEKGRLVKGRNEPMSISHVAHVIAKIKDLPVEDVCEAYVRCSMACRGNANIRLQSVEKFHRDVWSRRRNSMRYDCIRNIPYALLDFLTVFAQLRGESRRDSNINLRATLY
jgi:hypothetical protein